MSQNLLDFGKERGYVLFRDYPKEGTRRENYIIKLRDLRELRGERYLKKCG
jgi:hypothetical protein